MNKSSKAHLSITFQSDAIDIGFETEPWATAGFVKENLHEILAEFGQEVGRILNALNYQKESNGTK